MLLLLYEGLSNIGCEILGRFGGGMLVGYNPIESSLQSSHFLQGN